MADLIGSVVLTGTAAAGRRRRHRGRARGRRTVTSTDEGLAGPVAVSVHPWEITLEPPFAGLPSSARNRLAARVASVTRARQSRPRRPGGAGQALAAEVTPAAVAELDLAPGREVVCRMESFGDQGRRTLRRTEMTRRPPEGWLGTAFAAEIGAEAPDEETTAELLDLAATAAHASERIAAPIACFWRAATGAASRS